MAGQTAALVIAHSAQFRESLLVLLRAIPQIEQIYQAEDVPSALTLHIAFAPLLVLCDYDLAQGKVNRMLRRVKAMWPEARCVALVEDEQEREDAEDAGVDVALIKGVLAAKLLETIETLLS
jgi:DNA-binding NarL/FixJ family response regulator